MTEKLRKLKEWYIRNQNDLIDGIVLVIYAGITIWYGYFH